MSDTNRTTLVSGGLRITVEASPEELVDLIHRLIAPYSPASPHIIQPPVDRLLRSMIPQPEALPAPTKRGTEISDAERFWGATVPTSDPKPGEPDDRGDAQAWADLQETLSQSGGVAFYYLVSNWSTNFGVEGAPQPDRVSLLESAMESEGAKIVSFLRTAGGLTRAVREVMPNLSVRDSRLLAENIASVSSAVGWADFADTLEYDRKHRNIGGTK